MEKKIAQQALFVAPVTDHAVSKNHDFVFDLMDVLSSPVLTFDTSWADLIPARLLKQVTLARIIALRKNECLATYLECVIYIYTRSMEAPMSSEWVDIYTHVSCQTLQDWFGEDHWNETKAPKKLSEWLMSKLNRLRQFIYERRRKILKERLRDEKKEEKNAESEVSGKKIVSAKKTPHPFIQSSFNF